MTVTIIIIDYLDKCTSVIVTDTNKAYSLIQQWNIVNDGSAADPFKGDSILSEANQVYNMSTDIYECDAS